MSIDLGRRLIAAGAVLPEEVEAALFLSVARGIPFARVLLDRGAITERGLEEELERVGGLGMRQVAGAAELCAKLPKAMCRRLAALPTRADFATGVVDVAAADPLDPHLSLEFGFHLGAPIRVLRAPIAAVEEAIRRLELEEQEPEVARPRRVTPPFPHGAPQSTVPPPPEEAPIPLVRRIPGSAATREEAQRAAAEGDVQAPLPRSVIIEIPGQLPAVSFPSSYPPSMDVSPPRQRINTPPYGTPQLLPPSAERGPRATGVRRASRPAMPAINVPASRQTIPAPTLHDLPRPADVEEAAPSTERSARLPQHPALPVIAETTSSVPPPASRPKVRAPDGAPILEALEQASSRDAVIRLALKGMRLVARRLAVFVVKREGFHGWACNVELGDQDALRGLVIPADQPSFLATAAATGAYLGPVPGTPPHEGLLRVAETTSNDVAAVPVRVAGRVAMVLVADDLDDTLTATRFLGELAKAVGEALARLLSPR